MESNRGKIFKYENDINCEYALRFQQQRDLVETAGSRDNRNIILNEGRYANRPPRVAPWPPTLWSAEIVPHISAHCREHPLCPHTTKSYGHTQSMYICVCVCACVFLCVSVCVSMYVCMCVCVYVLCSVYNGTFDMGYHAFSRKFRKAYAKIFYCRT